MNKLERINLRILGDKNTGILLNKKEDIMEARKNNLPIITYIPKQNTSNKPPKYFIDFEKKVNTFIEEQRAFNNRVLEFIEKQTKINETIINRLDKIEKRIDNLVKQNNLVE